MRVHGVSRRLQLAAVLGFAGLLASGCSGLQPAQPQPSLTDEQGNLQLTYADIAEPLTGLRETDSGGQSSSGLIRLRPSGPPSGLTPRQKTDYWLGGTSEAMRRCGYVEEVKALKGLSQDASLFAQGANKVQGSRMASCAQARRLAQRILSSPGI